jgi:hypothetical protein
MWRIPAAQRGDTRRIGRLRVRWPAALSPPPEPLWRSAAEDALRTASTSERSRVVLVRHIGVVLPWRAGEAGPRALHPAFERALQAAIREAVPARAAGAGQAGAVWFADWNDAIGWRLEHAITGEPTPPWIEAALASQEILPATWRMSPRRGASTHAMFDAWMADPACAVAAAHWALQRLAADPRRMTPWLAIVAQAWGLAGPAGPVSAAARAATAEAAEPAAPDDQRVPSSLVAPIAEVLRHMVAVHCSAWPEAARAVVRARADASRSGSRPDNPGVHEASARAVGLRFTLDALVLPRADRPRPGETPEPIEVAQAPSTGRPRDTTPAGPVPTDPSAVEASESLLHGGGEPTQLGGLGLLVNLLDRLAFGDWLAAQPAPDRRALAMAPFRCVLVRALRRDAAGETPWLDALEAPAGTSLSAAAGRAWLRRAARALRAASGPGLHALLHRPARMIVTPTHLDLIFDLARTDVAVRRAALDADPGWVPWFGRIVTFYYEAGA